MFFVINKIEQVVHHTDGLQNPKNPDNPMLLGVYRTQSRTALFTVYSKKAYGEFWDEVERNKIPRRLWSSEMKTFSAEKVADAPKPPYILKLTVVGWIFVLLVIATFGLITYKSMKPPVAKPAEYVAMEQAPTAGDVFFGHYEVYKEKGNPLGAEIGFGWFKVVKAEGGDYQLAKSIEMHKSYTPKEQLNNTEFETESMSIVKLTEQTGYNLRFRSSDGLTEVYITDKK